MRKLAILIIIAVVVLFAILFLREQSQAAAIGTIDILEGSAEILRDEKSTKAPTGTEIRAADSIKVANGGRVAIILKDGSVFRLEAGTTVRIEELVYAENKLKEANVDIEQGKIWWNTMPLSSGGNVEVETPTLVATVRGTSFNTSYLGDLSSVYVSTHTVEVSLQSDPSKKLTLTGGMLIEIGDETAESDFAKGSVMVTQRDKNDWILFNETQDRLLAIKRGQTVSSSSSSAVSSTAASKARVSSAAVQKASVASVQSVTTAVSSAAAKPVSSAKAASSKASVQSSKAAVSSVAAKTLTRLVLTADQTTIDINDFTFVHVTAFYSDGSKEEIHDNSWFIEPAAVGVISSGKFQGKKAGEATVVADRDDIVSNSLYITVRQPETVQQPTVVRIAVNCIKEGSGARELPNASCKATAYYSDQSSADVTQSANWSVSGQAGGSITQTGYYESYNQGDDTITALYQDISGSTTITIP